MTAFEALGTSDRPSLRSRAVRTGEPPDRAFINRLRRVYDEKGAVMSVTTGRISVNFAEFTRVTLECLQKIVVEKVFHFTYEGWEHDADDRIEPSVRQAANAVSEYSN